MPKRKSRLAVACASALAAAGWAFADPPPAVGVLRAPANQPRADLQSSAEWKALSATWREASLVASGARGGYPFTEEQRQKLLKDLEDAPAQIKSLQSAGLLDETEAGLLRQDLPRLLGEVQRFRPRGMEMATCYRPMNVAPAAAANLAQQLPLLEKLAAAQVLRPQVIARVLETAERDLVALSDAGYLARYTELGDRANAQAVRDKARLHVEKIREALRKQSGSLDDSTQWKKIVEAWKTAGAMGNSSKTTTRQREDAKKALEEAVEAARDLGDRGLLEPAEAELLANDAPNLIRAMYYLPPADNTVVCHGAPAPLNYPALSLERLSRQLPLLRKAAQGGHLHRGVIEKVLPLIEQDVAALSAESALKSLEGMDIVRARQIRESAPAELQKIRKLLESSK